jgi:hypothetical protein
LEWFWNICNPKLLWTIIDGASWSTLCGFPNSWNGAALILYKHAGNLSIIAFGWREFYVS